MYCTVGITHILYKTSQNKSSGWGKCMQAWHFIYSAFNNLSGASLTPPLITCMATGLQTLCHQTLCDMWTERKARAPTRPTWGLWLPFLSASRNHLAFPIAGDWRTSNNGTDSVQWPGWGYSKQTYSYVLLCLTRITFRDHVIHFVLCKGHFVCNLSVS